MAPRKNDWDSGFPYCRWDVPVAPENAACLLSGPEERYILKCRMFTNFTATDRWTRKPVHCMYQALIVAIATRHADAVDVKFLLDGRPVWVVLPHPAWVQYKNRTGKLITDQMAREIAGHFLKSALESGEGMGREMYTLTVEETLKHLDAVVAEMQSETAAAR